MVELTWTWGQATLQVPTAWSSTGHPWGTSGPATPPPTPAFQKLSPLRQADASELQACTRCPGQTTLHLSLDPTSRGLTKTNLLLPRSAEAPLTSSTARSPAGLAEMATAETGRWLPPASAVHIMTCRKEGRQWAVVERNIVLPLSVFPTSWRIPRTRAVGESAEPLRPPEPVEPHV